MEEVITLFELEKEGDRSLHRGEINRKHAGIGQYGAGITKQGGGIDLFILRKLKPGQTGAVVVITLHGDLSIGIFKAIGDSIFPLTAFNIGGIVIDLTIGQDTDDIAI